MHINEKCECVCITLLQNVCVRILRIHTCTRFVRQLQSSSILLPVQLILIRLHLDCERCMHMLALVMCTTVVVSNKDTHICSNNKCQHANHFLFRGNGGSYCRLNCCIYNRFYAGKIGTSHQHVDEHATVPCCSSFMASN